ncbi:hypothetical protein [Nocardiopsis lucentensis]|uniref:hypothetical protein n=1 Tax=Nocardiopsis lucentensis TaxID=53441 RepID=UPI0003497A9B|nr:hypothetical protein [Nocardiopsis lucentensis]
MEFKSASDTRPAANAFPHAACNRRTCSRDSPSASAAWAHRAFNAYQGNHPVHRDADEVLELAVAHVMGVTVPQARTIRATT